MKIKSILLAACSIVMLSMFAIMPASAGDGGATGISAFEYSLPQMILPDIVEADVIAIRNEIGADRSINLNTIKLASVVGAGRATSHLQNNVVTETPFVYLC